MANAATMKLPDEHVVDADAEIAWTLPGRLYHDPAVFEAEKQTIFGAAWQYGCAAADVANPGDYVTLDLPADALFVVRGRDGELRGFHNVCQHRAHRLLEGKGNVKAVVTCPYHAWAYGLDGDLRAARNSENVKGFDKTAFGLKPVQVEAHLGMVFVNPDLAAPTLESQAGDMFADIAAQLPWLGELAPYRETRQDVGFTFEDDMAFNWKVLIDNCLECYHCAPAHPAFCDLIDMDSYRTTTHGLWSSAKSRLNKLDNVAYPVEADAEQKRGDFWYLWPNMTFGTFPGQANFLAFAVEPTGPETTTTRSDYFMRPGEQVHPSRSDYGRDVLWPEDKAICEAVHRGLKSRGYGQGRFIVDEGRSEISEHGVHHFQRLYTQAMGLA